MAMLGQRRQKRPATRKRLESPGAKRDDAGSVVIERLAHDGRGVAHDRDGKILFIEQALPGEDIEVAIHTQHGRYDEGHVRRILKASEERVTPGCAHFGRCGGCDLQHLAIEGQRRYKQQVLREHLARHDIELPEPALLADEAWGYRRRARLGVRVGSDNRIHMGYRVRGQDRLFNIEQCPILEPRLETLLQPMRTLIESLEAPRRLGHIELVAGDDVVMITLRQLRRVPGDLARWQQFSREHDLLLSVLCGEGEQPVLERLDDRPDTWPHYRALADDQGTAISVRSSDFLQANAKVNYQLVASVLAWAEVRDAMPVVDLFAGVGNFSLTLAAAGARVTAYEGRESMVQRLRNNAEAAGLSEHIDARCTDLSSAPADLENAALVVLDPPRAGAQGICQALAQRGPSRVLYVSCEPATLARDVRLLVDGGYRLVRALVADMFPQTAHLESLVLLERQPT
ncbi:23S rRNA (uracil(1939)-C(5))-methyltransferase RlmD [Kushneria pakistanensis]|uniref:23S rRNA (Uracil(1939)-C(5))-methyltransferase RlmD n=1 Tax=Kushneria pakistanensis TaxID=1508770 RepID=A0ABQ3FDK3_9GAMM|nr:TRAM domain-containing protein [Kushneria pakistanensis]GHC19462.1 23S rRNA (uracil(1939)-C(5))-methyltransferase RlmD [Kushneria pakistanensis]